MGKATILIVEDEENIAFLYSTILKKAGYTTAIYSKGEDAIDAINDSLSYDLGLVDLSLKNSKYDGWDVIKASKKRYGSKPMLLISCHDTSMYNGMSEKIADGKIAKPIDPNDLVEKVNSFLKI